MVKNKKTQKQIILLIVAILAVLGILGFLVMGYFSQPGEPGDFVEEKQAPPEIPITLPLTGEVVDAIPDRPSLAVKIEDDDAARPQTGLDEADIVWETLVEGGMSRFIAVYHSKLPENVGPVRSLRIADGPIVAPMNGILIFSGSNGHRFQEVAKAAGVQILEEDGGAKGFSRIGKNAPHNDFFTLQKGIDQADDSHKSAPTSDEFKFASSLANSSAAVDGSAIEGTITTVISKLRSPAWTFDAATNKFMRFAKSDLAKPFMAKSGAQISATNIISLNVTSGGTPEKDPAGTPELDMHVVGSGTGYVFTAGKVLPIKWSKASDTAPFQFTYIRVTQPEDCVSTDSTDGDSNASAEESDCIPKPKNCLGLTRDGVRATCGGEAGTSEAKTEELPLKLAPGNTWIELVDGSKEESVATVFTLKAA
jgi:hypothetical protein